MNRPVVLMGVWTVYERPRDYPQGFVGHLFEIRAGGITHPSGNRVFGPTLESVRAQLPPGLHRMPRDPNDEPQIVESWI